MRRKPDHIRRTLRLTSPIKSASSAHWVFELGIIFEDPFPGPLATQSKQLSDIVYLESGVLRDTRKHRCAIAAGDHPSL